MDFREEIPAENAFHQPIDVDADFSYKDKRCTPKSFTTKTGRTVYITEVGLIHPKYNGLKTMFLFDVTDGAADYRISFDTATMEWFLEWEGDQIDVQS